MTAPQSPNISALMALMDVPLALHGLTSADIRVIAIVLDRQQVVAGGLLPEEVRAHVVALAQRSL